jgi:hypothetical protein
MIVSCYGLKLADLADNAYVLGGYYFILLHATSLGLSRDIGHFHLPLPNATLFSCHGNHIISATTHEKCG